MVEVLVVLVIVCVIRFVLVLVTVVVWVKSGRPSVSEFDHARFDCGGNTPSLNSGEDTVPVKGEIVGRLTTGNGIPAVAANAAFVVKLPSKSISGPVLNTVAFVLVTWAAENRVLVMVIVGEPFAP